MAHSLEVRVPLLDHEVMEYAAGIPPEYKLHRGEGKYIFKKALVGIVPDEILNRTKMGFSIPLAGWLRGELRSVFEERVFSPNAFISNLFDQEVIRQWWLQHQRGTRNFAYHMWALLILESWGQKFMIDESGKGSDSYEVLSEASASV